MNNKLFYSLTIIGTVLMLLLLFSERQVVEAEQPAPVQSFADVYQTAINQLKSLADNADSDIARSNLDSKIQALEYKQSVQATAMTEPPKSLEEIVTPSGQMRVANRSSFSLTIQQVFWQLMKIFWARKVI